MCEVAPQLCSTLEIWIPFYKTAILSAILWAWGAIFIIPFFNLVWNLLFVLSKLPRKFKTLRRYFHMKTKGYWNWKLFFRFQLPAGIILSLIVFIGFTSWRTAPIISAYQTQQATTPEPLVQITVIQTVVHTVEVTPPIPTETPTITPTPTIEQQMRSAAIAFIDYLIAGETDEAIDSLGSVVYQQQFQQQGQTDRANFFAYWRYRNSIVINNYFPAEVYQQPYRLRIDTTVIYDHPSRDAVHEHREFVFTFVSTERGLVINSFTYLEFRDDQ